MRIILTVYAVDGDDNHHWELKDDEIPIITQTAIVEAIMLAARILTRRGLEVVMSMPFDTGGNSG